MTRTAGKFVEGCTRDYRRPVCHTFDTRRSRPYIGETDTIFIVAIVVDVDGERNGVMTVVTTTHGFGFDHSFRVVNTQTKREKNNKKLYLAGGNESP